jgi:hypothetical protein
MQAFLPLSLLISVSLLSFGFTGTVVHALRGNGFLLFLQIQVSSYLVVMNLITLMVRTVDSVAIGWLDWIFLMTK